MLTYELRYFTDKSRQIHLPVTGLVTALIKGNKIADQLPINRFDISLWVFHHLTAKEVGIGNNRSMGEIILRNSQDVLPERPRIRNFWESIPDMVTNLEAQHTRGEVCQAFNEIYNQVLECADYFFGLTIEDLEKLSELESKAQAEISKHTPNLSEHFVATSDLRHHLSQIFSRPLISAYEKNLG